MGSLTRGPLPAGVYWRRRLIVLVIAVALVVGITMLLRLGSDGDSGDNADDAAMAASEESSSAASSEEPVEESSDEPSTEVTEQPESSAPASTALPTPEGECASDDVVIESSVSNAYAFEPVTIQLRARTEETAACTWELDRDAIQVRLTREGRPLWSSVDCPSAVPSQQLTLYRDAATIVAMTWNGHRSDAGLCGPHAAWAQPGSYQIAVAAMGGEPSQAEFELLRPGQEESADTEDPSADPSDSASESETTEQEQTDQQRRRQRSGGTDSEDGTPTEGPRPGQRDEPTDLPD